MTSTVVRDPWLACDCSWHRTSHSSLFQFWQNIQTSRNVILIRLGREAPSTGLKIQLRCSSFRVIIKIVNKKPKERRLSNWYSWFSFMIGWWLKMLWGVGGWAGQEKQMPIALPLHCYTLTITTIHIGRHRLLL